MCRYFSLSVLFPFTLACGLHYGSAEVAGMLKAALWASQLKPRTTVVTSNGLKLQCISFAIFSSCISEQST